MGLLGWAKNAVENQSEKWVSKPQILDISEPAYERSLWDESFELYGKIEEAPYPEWLKPFPQNLDRQRVVSEQSRTVLVDLGGRRIIKKKKTYPSYYTGN